MRFYITVIIYLIQFQILNAQWIKQSSGTSQHLNDVFFINTNIGWAVGRGGTVLKTSNGGANWISQNSGTTKNLTSIFFLSTEIGWIAGNDGVVLRTSNGGGSWIVHNFVLNNSWESIFFIDANVGWVAGWGGEIAKTTNGGINWNYEPRLGYMDIVSIFFLDSNTGWLAGGNMGMGAVLMKTTNGGINWNNLNPSTPNPITRVKFINVSEGLLVGLGGIIRKTENGGNNWLIRSSGFDKNIYDLSYLPTGIGYAVGDSGKILFTQNSGDNWSVQYCGYLEQLWGVFTVDETTTYVVGTNGIILKYQPIKPPTTINKFPYQINPNSESAPIALSLNELILFWVCRDTIYSTKSINSGNNWQNPIPVISNNGGGIQNLVVMKTNSGRIILVYGNPASLIKIHSDDNGLSWSAKSTLLLNGRYPSISQTLDGKIWLFYNKYGTNSYDIYYITSNDNGLNWSSENSFLTTSFQEYYGTVVSVNSSKIICIYEDNESGNYDIKFKISTNNGINWSSPAIPIVNSQYNEVRPKILIDMSGSIYVYYQLFSRVYFGSSIYVYQDDLYYTKSSNGGDTWATPTRITTYNGYDGWHNLTLLNDTPFISFASDRWSSTRGQYIWYGIQENNVPPNLSFNSFKINSDNKLDIQAFVSDDSGISNVLLKYFINGTQFGPIQMYDDGLHNDSSANDNIWGVRVGPLNAFDSYNDNVKIIDLNGNDVEIYANNFIVSAIHNAGNFIISLKNNSTLGEQGERAGTSGYWPKIGGKDYLYLGGLWIGSQVGGSSRVSNRDYREIDWNRTSSIPSSLSPGISDLDGNVTYDDNIAVTPPIGLRINQRSYQWSDTTKDDFIIFKYNITNLGTNGVLNNTSVSLWLDPDVSTSADQDIGGYDPSRKLMYLYSSNGSPSGYFGLKLLGNSITPHTVNFYKIVSDPNFDSTRYIYMTKGILPELPNTPGDYRMLMAVQIPQINVNETKSVSYGIVIGKGLAELQANADTMEKVFNDKIVSVEGDKNIKYPSNCSLSQNYPNPFNPTTKISYSIPKNSFVKLEIFNTLGEKIASLVNEEKEVGYYDIEWNANVSSGIYFYKIEAIPIEKPSEKFVQIKKMVLMK